MPSTCLNPHGNRQWPVPPGPPHRQRRQVGSTNRWRLAPTPAGDMLGQAQAWRAFSLTNPIGSAFTLQLCEIPSSQELPTPLTSSLPPIAVSQPAGPWQSGGRVWATCQATLCQRAVGYVPQQRGMICNLGASEYYWLDEVGGCGVGECEADELWSEHAARETKVSTREGPGVHQCPEQSFYMLSQKVTQNSKPDAVLQCLGSIWELHLPYLSRSKTLAELYKNHKKQRNYLKLLQERAGCSRTGMSGWHGGAGCWAHILKENGGMMWVSRGSLRCTLLQLPVHDHSVTKEAVSFALRTLYLPTECPEQWGGAVLSAAVLLGLPDLYQRCLDGMMASITSYTVCDFHQASCEHKQIGLQAACEHWLELFLVTDLSSHIGLRDLPFDLLLRTLRCSRVFAVSEYDLLRTVLYWVYLQFNTSDQTLPSYSTVISFFYGTAGVFLEQPVGHKYIPLFQALHLHGVTERHHVEEIEKMKVFPRSWLLHTFSSHYHSIHSGGDMNVTNFSKHSVRFGMIVGGVQYTVISDFIFGDTFAFILQKVTQELQEYTQAIGLYGFYFLLKASRVGDADEFGFSLERLRHWDPALTESCRTTQPFSMRAERCVCYQIRVQSCGSGERMEKSSGVISQVFGLSKRCCRSKVFTVGGLSIPLYVTFALAFPTP